MNKDNEQLMAFVITYLNRNFELKTKGDYDNVIAGCTEAINNYVNTKRHITTKCIRSPPYSGGSGSAKHLSGFQPFVAFCYTTFLQLCKTVGFAYSDCKNVVYNGTLCKIRAKELTKYKNKKSETER